MSDDDQRDDDYDHAPTPATTGLRTSMLGTRGIALRVSGARVGSAARPTADGAATGYGLAKPRFGLRAHASRLKVGPQDPSRPPGSDDEAAG